MAKAKTQAKAKPDSKSKYLYRDTTNYKWFSNQFIGTCCGRIRYVFRVLQGLSPECRDPEELYALAQSWARYFNQSLPVGEHVQLYIRYLPDVSALIEQHMKLVKNESPLLLELTKERCRMFLELAQEDRLGTVEIYIAGGVDPYQGKRATMAFGMPRPDFKAMLRKKKLTAPTAKINPDVAINLAMERYEQIRTALEGLGLKVELLNAEQNKLLLAQAQCPWLESYPDEEIDTAPGRYTFYENYIVQNYQDRKTYYRCLTTGKAPESTFAGMLIPLISQGLIVRASLSVFKPDPTVSRLKLQIKRSVIDLSNSVQAMAGKRQKTEAGLQESELNSIEQNLFANQLSVVHIGMVVVVSASTLAGLDSKTKQVVDAMGQNGVTLELALRSQEDLWHTSLPGAATPIPLSFQTAVLPQNAGEMLLPTLPWAGSEQPYMLFANRWKQVVGFNPFGSENAHTLISGKTGSGKSALTIELLLQAASAGWRVAIIDRFGSYYPCVKYAMNGMARKLEPGTFTINPFQYYLGNDEHGNQIKIEDSQVPPLRADALKNFFLTILNREEDAELRPVISKAIDLTYRAILPLGRFPIIEDMVRVMRELRQGMNLTERDIEIEIQSQTFIDALDMVLIGLNEFTTANMMESLTFNGQNSDEFFKGDALYFDLEPLGEESTTAILVAQLLAIGLDEWVRKVEKRTILCFDEIWSFLTRNPNMTELMIKALRAYRRYGVMVVLVTQSFQDILSTPHAVSLFDQTTNRFALKQDKFKEAASAMEVNQTTVELVTTLNPTQQGYYSEVILFLKQENQATALMSLMTPLRYWIMTSSTGERGVRQYGIEILGLTPQEVLVALAREYPRGFQRNDTNVEPARELLQQMLEEKKQQQQLVAVA